MAFVSFSKLVSLPSIRLFSEVQPAVFLRQPSARYQFTVSPSALIAAMPAATMSTKRAQKSMATCSSTAGLETLADFTIPMLGGGTREAPTQGEPLSFAQFKGKVTLIENVASL